MSSYITGKFLDDYDNNDKELQLYNTLAEEECNYYQDNEDMQQIHNIQSVIRMDCF